MKDKIKYPIKYLTGKSVGDSELEVFYHDSTYHPSSIAIIVKNKHDVGSSSIISSFPINKKRAKALSKFFKELYK
jgi:hypothetical protein